MPVVQLAYNFNVNVPVSYLEAMINWRHAGSGTEPNLNNIPDNPTVATVNTSFTDHHKDFETPKSTLQQATVYTAFSDIPSSNVPNSTDPSEAYEAGQPERLEVLFQPPDRFQANNGVCERSALQLPENEHHDSSEHAEVPFREGIAVQQRQQVQKEKNRIQQQIHRNNIRFAVQGARAVAARQKQKQFQSAERVPLRDGLGNPSGGAGTSSGNIAGTTRKNKSQFLLSDKSATRAYVDRVEAWFGEGVLEGHLGQLERPVSPTPPPLSIATAVRSTETALNQLKRSAHSPDSVGSNKRSRWATSSSVIESEMLSNSTAAGGAHDDVAGDEETTTTKRRSLKSSTI
ncbi:hypothetical protein BT96DRAFT_995045 [Gymnopus androsaceus JB14]|uniref:Uncharacterized protein n=1 Tax=Gymnopus androsaceus JB14 TaxID=1447944 RepID=A0A6A4HN77_9AGAR|nr:hypothetical protein BT96DRAFT_995045 [Gymnopus androsaceus JB14]